MAPGPQGPSVVKVCQAVGYHRYTHSCFTRITSRACPVRRCRMRGLRRRVRAVPVRRLPACAGCGAAGSASACMGSGAGAGAAPFACFGTTSSIVCWPPNSSCTTARPAEALGLGQPVWDELVAVVIPLAQLVVRAEAPQVRGAVVAHLRRSPPGLLACSCQVHPAGETATGRATENASRLRC